MGNVLGVVAALVLSLAVVGCGYERPANVPGPADAMMEEPSTCGDGVRTGSEPCDDGNSDDGDGCDRNCTPTGCGNGIQTLGEFCDDGNATNGDGCDVNCTTTACGNGVQTAGESCDDDNVTNGDGCDSDCSLTGCGNGIKTAGEACDDGNLANGDGCDSNCTPTGCGNGVMTTGEVCDDGDLVSGDGCDSNCTPTGCGNGVMTAGEACDDGDLVSGDGCDSNCTPTGCGNGVITSSTGETCDDSNQVTEVCAYDQPSCTVCNATCQSVPGQISFCGDGIAQSGFEVCDDGNATCGTCSANCQVFSSAGATGSISVVRANEIDETSDSFTLDDGINPPVTFEFTFDGTVDTSNVAIMIVAGQNATTVRNLARDAINNIEIDSGFINLLITATTGGSTGTVVNLTHDLFTGLGNNAITETVSDSDFTVAGMSGGAGGDCVAGQACANDEDCESNDCQMNVCQ